MRIFPMDLIENLMVMMMCSYLDKFSFSMEISRTIVYALENGRVSAFCSPQNGSEL